MKPRKIMRLTAIFWLLTFIGQALAASAVHCNMQLMASMSPNSAVDHSQMDHSSMGHSEMAEDILSVEADTDIMDCCQLGADCSEGNCSYVYLALEASQFEFQSIKSALLHFPSAAPSKLQNSLYRPPIMG